MVEKKRAPGPSETVEEEEEEERSSSHLLASHADSHLTEPHGTVEVFQQNASERARERRSIADWLVTGGNSL